MIYCIGHMYRQYFDLTLAKVRVYQNSCNRNERGKILFWCITIFFNQFLHLRFYHNLNSINLSRYHLQIPTITFPPEQNYIYQFLTIYDGAIHKIQMHSLKFYPISFCLHDRCGDVKIRIWLTKNLVEETAKKRETQSILFKLSVI